MAISNSQQNPERRHRFVVLDGLRGGAAIMVVITHTSSFAPMAYLAVGFFFSLSGFVLAYSAGEKLRLRGAAGRAHKRRYAVGRLIRLYPLYAAGTVIALLPAVIFVWVRFAFWTPRVFAEALVAAPFFIPLPFDWNFPLDMPGWTLTFELFANLVFLFTGWRWLPICLITLLSLPSMLWDPGNAYWAALASEVPVALFCFFLGVVMCRLWCENRLPKIGLHPLALLLILCTLLGYPTNSAFVYPAVFTVALQPLILWAGACTSVAGFSERLMAWLGRVSYGTYVLHFPIYMWLTSGDRLLAKIHPHLAGRIDKYAVLLVLPAALIAAHVLTKYLDVPLRKWLTMKYDGSRFSKKVEGEAVVF